jgi:hypothetical protein
MMEVYMGIVEDMLSCMVLDIDVKLLDRARATGERPPDSLARLGELARLLGVRGSL